MNNNETNKDRILIDDGFFSRFLFERTFKLWEEKWFNKRQRGEGIEEYWRDAQLFIHEYLGRELKKGVIRPEYLALYFRDQFKDLEYIEIRRRLEYLEAHKQGFVSQL